MAAVIVASGVSFRLPNGRALFEDLELSLDQRPHALVGPNGIGKTTLARLLVGELEASSGRIHRRAPVTMLSQREAPSPGSVDAYLSPTDGWSPLPGWSKLGQRLLAGIDREAPCATLSGGEWMRVRLARALDGAGDGAFLVLDEPTNDLDRDARRVVLDLLEGHRGGVLLISHDRECLRTCDRVLELSTHGIATFGGGWDDYVESSARERRNLEERLQVAKREREDARREQAERRARQEKRSARGARLAARGGVPKILLGKRKANAQATTGKIDVGAQRRLDDKVQQAYEALGALKVDPVMYADLVGAEVASQKLLARACDFNVRFGRWVFSRDLTFTWHGGSRVVVRGANGAGKSTLMRALRGETLETRGALQRGELRTLYLDQRLAHLDDEASVLDNVRAHLALSETDARNGLAKFLFTKEAVFQKVASLSGGERLRAALAIGFLAPQPPQLLILDEPTNNLDLANVEFLERVVGAFRGALIVVSHDEAFIERCAPTEALAL